MKKTIMICVVIGLMFIGCSSMAKWMDAQALCANDSQCLADTKGYAKIGEAVASPFGPIAGAGATAVITFMALGILGLRKKKE